jgi:hypothetical protein
MHAEYKFNTSFSIKNICQLVKLREAVWCDIIIIKNNKQTSLILLKVKAFIADFKVPLLKVQKFIKKNENKPINSQPKNKRIELSDKTNKDILRIKKFNNNIKRSAFGSFLK